jgi:hypothetical protein
MTDITGNAALSLSEQLDAMLHGWLERAAGTRRPAPPGLRGRAVLTIARAALDEVERFCAKWDMTLERHGSVVTIEGPALAVEGFAAITAMYRR